MESDSNLAWLVLAISLAGYSLITLADRSLASVPRERAQWLVAQGVAGSKALNNLHSLSMGPTGALTSLRSLLLTSSTLSAAAVAIAYWRTDWGLISLMALAVLAVAGLVNIAAGAVASVRGERIALRSAFLVWALSRVFRPVVAVQDGAARRLARAGGGGADLPGDALLPERISLDADGEPLDEREVKMIRGVVRLDKTTAREIMVPRGDMVAAELGTSPDDLAKQMLDSGHSKVPIYDGSLDQIKGIAYARDVMAHLSRNEEAPGKVIDGLIRPGLFIPESKTLEELLNEFQELRVHIAIVVDEYGGVSGLVTIEDLLEEIVGEINDEFDVGEAEIVQVGDGEYLVEARVGIEQINELLDVFVEADGFDTLGGFVYQRLGRMPSSGEKVEYDGLDIEVISIIGRRLKRLRVTKVSERTAT